MAEKPEKIGKYVVLDILGKGGMGIVYKALDPILNRQVAIKMMVSAMADEELKARFYREAQSLGTLHHPNIITIYDLGQEGENPYFSMEFLTGTDLDKIIKTKQPLELLHKLDIMRQVCEGLECAHRAGIIHRDIKPANIRVLDDGNVKIMDFGIARMSTSATMTRSGLIMGTVHYMSPEQIKGVKVDGRSDIFSVGAVLFELLTYVKPFHADTMTSVLYKIVNEPPPPLETLGVSASPELIKILEKALSKDIHIRYQEVGKMARELRELCEKMKKARQTEVVAQQIDVLLAEGEQRSQERVEPEPPQVTRILAEGRELFAGQFYEDALQRFREALTLSPGNIEAISLVEACEKREEDERRKIQTLLQNRRRESADDSGPQYVEFGERSTPKLVRATHARIPSGQPDTSASPTMPTAVVVRRGRNRLARAMILLGSTKALAVVLVALAIVVALLLMEWLRSKPAPTPPPAPAATWDLQFDVQPWAQIQQVINLHDQKAVEGMSGKFTPCHLALPEGTYRIRVVNLSMDMQKEFTVEVKSNSANSFRGSLDGFDASEVAASLTQ